MEPARIDLPIADHLDGLRVALLAFADVADRLPAGTPVPTCPDWRVGDLVAHQGMVHRWAAATLTAAELDTEAVLQEGRRSNDRGEWLRDGAIEFVTALTSAPADVQALVFLRDAPPAKQFWARRQCHETTIHAVDAVGADLGRFPESDELPWLTARVAADGIDELLTGFVPRSKSTLRTSSPTVLCIDPADCEQSWRVELSTDAPVTTRCTSRCADADIVVDQPVVDAYLALWNRGTAFADRPELTIWREQSAVTW